MLFKIRKSDVSTHYHNTRTFLNKYRDISWILEVSALNLQKEFKATYELFTDSPPVAGEIKDVKLFIKRWKRGSTATLFSTGLWNRMIF